MAMVKMDELFEELRQCVARRNARLGLVAQGTSEDSMDAEDKQDEIYRKNRKKKYRISPCTSQEKRIAQYELDHEAALHRLKGQNNQIKKTKKKRAIFSQEIHPCSYKMSRKVADSDYDIRLDGFDFTTGKRFLQVEDLRKLFENVSTKENPGKS